MKQNLHWSMKIKISQYIYKKKKKKEKDQLQRITKSANLIIVMLDTDSYFLLPL